MSVADVIRGCASATVTSDDCVSGSYDGNSADICSCSLPLCNTATPMKFSVAGLIVVCVLTLMHRMIL